MGSGPVSIAVNQQKRVQATTFATMGHAIPTGTVNVKSATREMTVLLGHSPSCTHITNIIAQQHNKSRQASGISTLIHISVGVLYTVLQLQPFITTLTTLPHS